MLKIGTERVGPIPKKPMGPKDTLFWTPPATPMLPIRKIRGKNSDFATPMRAFAATSCTSARRTSGRRSSKAAGSPAGRDGRAIWPSSARPRGIGPGFRPRSTLMRFSVCSICRSKSGISRKAP